MPDAHSWPQDFEGIRAKAEKRLGKTIERLNRDARQRLLEAVKQYGGVDAIPQAVWDDIEREAFLLFVPIMGAIAYEAADVVLISLDAQTTPRLVNATLEPLTAETARTSAQQYAKGLRKGVERRWLDSLPTNSPEIPDSSPLDQYQPETPAELVARSRLAIIDATEWVNIQQGAARIERAAGTDATASISNGTRGAAAIFQAANPHQRVTLVWRVRKTSGVNVGGGTPAESVCPICLPLEGLPDSVWQRYMSAPPAHYNCRCELQVFIYYDFPTGIIPPAAR